MLKIDNHLAFVKEQVSVQEKLARKYDEDTYRSGLHLKTARSMADLARFLEEVQKRGLQNSAYLSREDTPQKRILLTYEEIENAPEDLLKELNLSESDRQELLIEYMIADAGGILSLDKIIVGLFNKTGKVPSRTTVTQRLFRMGSRGMIYNVPGKKGVYSTYELSEADAKKMFGQFDAETTEETPSAPPTAPTPVSQASGAPTFKRRLLSGTSGAGSVVIPRGTN